MLVLNWVMAVLGFFFLVNDLRDRDYIGAFLAGGLTLCAIAALSTS